MRCKTFWSAATIIIISLEGNRTTFIFSPGKLHTKLNSKDLRNSSSMWLLSKFERNVTGIS